VLLSLVMTAFRRYLIDIERERTDPSFVAMVRV